MRAVILAGGKGTRLAPYTMVLPKPLMPIGDMPILEVVVRQLKSHGFSRITMAVGHLAELLQAFFGDGRKFGIEIDYSIEDRPLGTAGPLAYIEEMDDTFLVMNGDILTTLDYSRLLKYHRSHGGIATIATHHRQVHIDFGVIDVNQSNELMNYTEKPTLEYLVSMGIYVFEARILQYITKEEYLDFPALVKSLLAKGEKVVGYPSREYWLDIGRPDDYAKASEEFERMREKFLK